MDTHEYIKLAEVEDRMWYFRALHGHVHRLLKSGLKGVNAPRVLDAGCGTGGLIARLQAREPGWRFTGIDFSPLACGFAARRCVGAEIREASVTALPFADGSFDAVVSADVLYQVDEPGNALKEFGRCLAPGGVAVINVPAYRWLWSYHDKMVQTQHRFRRSEVVGLLRAAGFSVKNSTYWNTLLFPAVVARRKLFPPREGSGDVRMYPPILEAGCNVVMAGERGWLTIGGRLPFGSSVLVFAQKRG